MRLFVRLDGEQFRLAQVGGGRLYFDQPTSLRPGPAEIIVEIDGEPNVTRVTIKGSAEPATIVEYSAA